jgi:glycosyltransferase involved in cell wall biosynthesis
MKVLNITGDKSFGPGHPRYELQCMAVEELAVVYWGRGALVPHIPQGPFDVVTAQDPFWRGLVAWHVARRIGAQFNVQVHADVSAQSFVKHILAQIVLRHADSVRVVSEKIKEQVLHIAPNTKISVLPVFIDVSKFRTGARIPHEAKTILWIGRFEEEKNPRGAIEVFKDVLTNLPDAKLVMLGKGSQEQVLRRAAVGLAVEFPGWQDPLPYMEAADVVLSTSWHESFGASMIEALAADVPVVAPDVGVAKEAGAIVVPRNELAQKVVSVLKEGAHGQLKIPMLDKTAWADAWRNTLS